MRKKERRVRRRRIFIQPPEMVDCPKSGDLHNKYVFLHSKRSIKQQHKEKLSLLVERDGLVVFGCRREPAIAADVCLCTVVVLGLQLLVHAEHAGALHR